MVRLPKNINIAVQINGVFIKAFLLFLLASIHIKCADKNHYSKSDKTIQADKKKKPKKIQHQTSPEFKVANALFNNYKYIEAIDLYKPLTYKFERSKNYRLYLYGLISIGNCYFNLGNYTEGRSYLYKAVIMGKQYLKDTLNPLMGEAHLLLGKCFEKMNEPDSALDNLNRSLSIIASIYNANSKEVVPIYNAIGSVYRYNLMDYSRAEEYHGKSLKILEKQTKARIDNKLIECYYNLATTNRLKGDYEKALSFGLQSLKLSKILKSSYWEEISYGAIAVIYYYRKDYVNSLACHKKALKMTQRTSKDSNYPQYLINIGGVYYSMGKCDTAIYYYKNALNLSNKYNNLSIQSDSYLHLGEAYAKIEKNDLAFHCLEKCLQTRQNSYHYNNHEVAVVYLFLGKLYQSLEKHDSAIIMFQRAFLRGIPTFNKTSKFSNPNKSQLIRHPDYLLTLIKKALSLKEIYKERKDEHYLLASMESYLLIDQVLDMQRELYDNEYSKMIFNEQSKELYDEAIDCCFILYKKFGTQDYLKNVFFFMEKSKASILWENLKGAEAFTKVGVPNSIRTKESSLKSKLAFYQNKLFQQSQDINNVNLNNIHEKILNISKDLELLKSEVASKYPSYYRIKYESPRLSLISIMKYAAKNKSSFIEYHFGTNGIYTLTITGNGINFIKISNIDTVNNLIYKFQSLIKNAEPTLGSEKSFSEYNQCAFSIYKKLVEPCLPSNHKIKNLIIIPDEALSLIPFEATIVAPYKKHSVNYRDLRYLIKEYNVQYCYSTNIFFSKSPNEDRDINLIAFDYASTNTKLKKDILDVPGTKDELLLIQKVIGGKFFFGSNATEDNFKKHVASANIIHLAVHGMADTLNPLNSRLIFVNNPTSNEDGVLHSYELYNIKLNAKLIVLSACKTGIGKNYKSEGIMSIGRAFRYSGGASLVMSLWNINDHSTSGLIGDFYSFISQGNTLSKSLTKAKSKYLIKADEITAHPLYWAGLLAYGNVDDIIIENESYKSLYIGALVLLFLIIGSTMIWIFKIKRMNK